MADPNDSTILDSPDVSSLAASRPLPAPPLPQQQSTQPPRVGTPLLYNLVRGLVKPPTQMDPSTGVSRPTGRLDVFESFLGNFMQALGSGFQNAGHGPGAAMRGAGAAMTAPYQNAVQQWQLGQQGQLNQAELAQRQAQTGLLQQQAQYYPQEQQARIASLTQQPRFDPTSHAYLGNMTDAQMAAYIKGQGAANLRTTNQVPDAKKAILARLDTAAQIGDANAYNQALKELTDIANTKTAGTRQGALDRLRLTQQFQTWKTKFDGDIRLRVAQMTQNKAPAAMMQTAEFSKSGLNLLDDAQTAFNDLKNRGVLGSVSSDKLEEWLFGKGLIDPSLAPKDRQEISAMRAALNYTSTAAMRAHTGRTSQEIYNDFKSTLGLGQGSDALEGAFSETRNMLTEYANSASDANIQAIRNAGSSTPANAGGGNRLPFLNRGKPATSVKGGSKVDSLVSRYAQ